MKPYGATLSESWPSGLGISGPRVEKGLTVVTLAVVTAPHVQPPKPLIVPKRVPCDRGAHPMQHHSTDHI